MSVWEMMSAMHCGSSGNPNSLTPSQTETENKATASLRDLFRYVRYLLHLRLKHKRQTTMDTKRASSLPFGCEYAHWRPHCCSLWLVLSCGILYTSLQGRHQINHNLLRLFTLQLEIHTDGEHSLLVSSGARSMSS